MRYYSLQVLPNLIPCDFVLLDGDHNWYTVYHELKILEKCSRFPITFLHDLKFPAARRDVYYFPDLIPKEHLKPYAYKFPVKGQHKLSEHSSAPHFAFAEYEGVEKNGALTAVEDFLREIKYPLLLHRIHSSFGLGIVVPSESEQDKEWNHIVYNSIMSWTEGRDYLYSQYRYPI